MEREVLTSTDYSGRSHGRVYVPNWGYGPRGVAPGGLQGRSSKRQRERVSGRLRRPACGIRS